MTTTLDSQRPQNTFLSIFMCLLVILTNLSQMPVLVDAGTTQFLSVPAWGILFVYCLFSKHYPKVGAFKLYLWLAVFFTFFYLIACALDEAYTRTALPSVIFLATFVLLCSSAAGASLTEGDIERIFTCYILSVLVVGFDVYQTYLSNTTAFFEETRMYLYGSKNSISQILLSAWILILFTKLKTKLWIRLAYIAAMLFLTYELLMLQSRASIAGMPVALLFAVWSSKTSRNTKIYAWIIIIAIVIALSYSGVFTYLRDYILYAGRNAADINDISSGRTMEWIKFADVFNEHPFFGVGRCKRESIILTALLEFGIVGGLPILIMALSPLFFMIKAFRRLKKDSVFSVFAVITLVYLLNGVFEQLAPFGPGAKCFFLWFLYGILATKLYIKKHHG